MNFQFQLVVLTFAISITAHAATPFDGYVGTYATQSVSCTLNGKPAQDCEFTGVEFTLPEADKPCLTQVHRNGMEADETVCMQAYDRSKQAEKIIDRAIFVTTLLHAIWIQEYMHPDRTEATTVTLWKNGNGTYSLTYSNNKRDKTAGNLQQVRVERKYVLSKKN